MGDVVGDEDGRVPVAEFVAGLREELKAAQAARDPQLQFKVGPVTVEFAVVTGREGGPEGKVRVLGWSRPGVRPGGRRLRRRP
jgi:hypothetical protein